MTQKVSLQPPASQGSNFISCGFVGKQAPSTETPPNKLRQKYIGVPGVPDRSQMFIYPGFHFSELLWR